jgi:hypothetical protein
MKHLLTLTQLTKPQLSQIFEMAVQMRRIVTSPYKKGPQLLGSTVAGVYAQQNAVALAFTLATNYLSGSPVAYTSSGDITDVCLSLSNMGVDSLIVGSLSDNLLYSISQSVAASVVNAGSSQASPIEVLADVLTISNKLDGLSNLSVLAVGNRDVNKMAELNHVLELYSSSLIWYLPREDFATTRRGIVLDKIDVAFSGVDAVVDLGLTEFSDAVKYYGTAGGIDERLLDKARIDVPLLGTRHIVDNVGIKVYPHNCASARDTNLVAVAMAVLYLMHKG